MYFNLHTNLGTSTFVTLSLKCIHSNKTRMNDIHDIGRNAKITRFDFSTTLWNWSWVDIGTLGFYRFHIRILIIIFNVQFINIHVYTFTCM